MKARVGKLTLHSASQKSSHREGPDFWSSLFQSSLVLLQGRRTTVHLEQYYCYQTPPAVDTVIILIKVNYYTGHEVHTHLDLPKQPKLSDVHGSFFPLNLAGFRI